MEKNDFTKLKGKIINRASQMNEDELKRLLDYIERHKIQKDGGD